MNLKNLISGLIGVIGAIITSLFGGWTGALTTLCIFMGFDYITGILVAAIWHNSDKSESGGLESRAGFKGLVRKGVILLIVLVSHRLDLLLSTQYIMDAVVIAFCCNELISLIENVGLMGVPIPEVIKDAIEVLKGKGDSNDSRTSN